MVRLDDVNRSILQALRTGPVTHVELARRLGRSESTVRDRIRALEASGLVRSHLPRPDADGGSRFAIVRCDCPMDRIRDVAQGFRDMPAVVEAHVVAGPRPVLALLAVRDEAHLGELLLESLPRLPVRDVEASVVVQDLVGGRASGEVRLTAPA
jgi:Lrp/AsnC family transcriptional regulator, leucine-responsive regulatory protein